MGQGTGKADWKEAFSDRADPVDHAGNQGIGGHKKLMYVQALGANA